MTSAPTDAELLRVVAHAALTHLDRLIDEGLHGTAVENVAAHALALTAPAMGGHDDPSHRRSEAIGLWELLGVLTGPVSTTLMTWLDDALGAAHRAAAERGGPPGRHGRFFSS